jgi:hypothetical protein
MMRKGFKEWADAGFPRDGDGQARPEVLPARQGQMAARRLGRGLRILAKALDNIARTYSGEPGQKFG